MLFRSQHLSLPAYKLNIILCLIFTYNLLILLMKIEWKLKAIKMANHRYAYRMRVGSYRVLFNILETVEIISIEEVRKRDERTYSV